MAIGSPPRFESSRSSRVADRSGRAKVAGLLLIASAALGFAAWHFLSTSESTRSTADPTPDRAAEPARAPEVAAPADPDFARRLIDAAQAAKRVVTVTLRVPAGSVAGALSLEMLGGFEAPPEGSDFAGPWSFARADFNADGSVAVEVPAAWPRARRLRLARLYAGALLRRDLPLPGAPLDLGEWRAPAGGRVEGVVREAGGRPVANARVALEEVASDLLVGGAAGAGALGSTNSDASGAFVLANVAARRVRVEVSGVPGRANGVVADAEVFGEALSIELAPPASIRGRLLDAEGRPIAGGRVVARMAGPEETSGEASAPTGSDGAFALDALAIGYYSLLASCDGYAPRYVARAHTDVTGLDVKLDRLATAHFVLVNGPKGWTAPATWRIVEPAATGVRWTTPPELAWAHERDLFVRGVPAGRCALEIALPGAAPIVTPVVTFEANATTEVGTFTLAAGAEVALVVTDDAGRPVRARLALASPHFTDAASGRDPFLLDHEERVNDDTGRCTWRDLPAGRRVVAAHPLDGTGADAVATIDVPARGRIDAPALVIRPGGAIDGSVRERDGPPLSEMTVVIEGPGRKLEATTDADGRYEARGLPPGRYLVVVLRRDDAPPRDLGDAFAPRENPTATVEVEAGKTTARDFSLDVD